MSRELPSVRSDPWVTCCSKCVVSEKEAVEWTVSGFLRTLIIHRSDQSALASIPRGLRGRVNRCVVVLSALRRSESTLAPCGDKVRRCHEAIVCSHVG
eukprot:3653046-Amphidinium_carterae.1